jgi:hypothetical protein
VFVGLVALADPYNYFRPSSFIPNEVKHNTSFKFHYPLWKCIEFNRNPQENIVLGDSRTDFLGTAKIDSFTGTNWFNFAYGGATFREITETFWYADTRTKLKNVYIGLNFNLMNAYKRMDRVAEAESIMEEPLLYPFNKTVVKAFFYNIYSTVTGTDPKIGAPEMSPDEFWKFQLDKSAENYYASFLFNEDGMEELRHIALRCDEHNIKLVFFIPPTHTDLQKRIDDFGLRTASDRWKEELAKIAPVIDMDVPNEFTSNRENFKDPYHLKEPSPVIQKVWGK